MKYHLNKSHRMKLFYKTILLFALFVLTAASLEAQKTLILEKRGTTKTKRFYEGDEITYRLKGEDVWETATIIQMIPSQNILVLDKLYIKVDEISALLKRKNRRVTNGLSSQLYVFGTAWITYTAIDDLVVSERRTDWEAAAYVGGTSFLVGTLLRLLPKKKIIKLGKKRRLRLLDLTPIAKPILP